MSLKTPIHSYYTLRNVGTYYESLVPNVRSFYINNGLSYVTNTILYVVLLPVSPLVWTLIVFRSPEKTYDRRRERGREGRKEGRKGRREEKGRKERRMERRR